MPEVRTLMKRSICLLFSALLALVTHNAHAQSIKGLGDTFSVEGCAYVWNSNQSRWICQRSTDQELGAAIEVFKTAESALQSMQSQTGCTVANKVKACLETDQFSPVETRCKTSAGVEFVRV